MRLVATVAFRPARLILAYSRCRGPEATVVGYMGRHRPGCRERGRAAGRHRSSAAGLRFAHRSGRGSPSDTRSRNRNDRCRCRNDPGFAAVSYWYYLKNIDVGGFVKRRLAVKNRPSATDCRPAPKPHQQNGALSIRKANAGQPPIKAAMKAVLRCGLPARDSKSVCIPPFWRKPVPHAPEFRKRPHYRHTLRPDKTFDRRLPAARLTPNTGLPYRPHSSAIRCT